jgi:hypothetical protein
VKWINHILSPSPSLLTFPLVLIPGQSLPYILVLFLSVYSLFKGVSLRFFTCEYIVL